jgi:hypothetical protein
MIGVAILCFGSTLILDVVWAYYTKAIVANRPIRAASYGGVIMGLNGSAMIGVTHDPWMLIPAIAGAFIGTYIGVRL